PRTPAISSASRGERAARTQMARISWSNDASRSSSSTTSSAMAGSAKNSAAYPRSTMSSEVSLASESMALRFLGRSSIAMLPVHDFGWWRRLGGTGNPVVGVGRKSATPGALQTIVPAVFVTLLIIGLPLLVEGEEWVFRRGAQHRSRAANARRSVLFGLVHSLVGIPIGVAAALSPGGFYFTRAYLRVWRTTGPEAAARP